MGGAGRRVHLPALGGSACRLARSRPGYRSAIPKLIRSPSACSSSRSTSRRRPKASVQVALYYNSQLGGERESVEQVKGGSLEMATASAGPLTTFNNKFMVLDIPFAFDSYEIAWGVLDGPMGQKLLDSSEGIGLKGLGLSGKRLSSRDEQRPADQQSR